MLKNIQIFAILIVVLGSILLAKGQEIAESSPNVNSSIEKAQSSKTLYKTKRQVSENDYHQWEVYGGYQFAVTEESLRFHSFNVAPSGNFHKYFGAKMEFSGAYEKRRTNDNNFDVYDKRHQFLGGIQVKNNSKTKNLKPFAHALFGLAILQQRNCSTVNGQCFQVNSGSNHFAMSFGGVFDVRVNKRFDVRLFQVDYNPIRYRSGFWGQTFRVGAGIVFH